MKKKLLIVAGAGASIEFGMPSVSTIDQLFDSWGVESFPLASDPTGSLYSFVKERSRQYYSQNKRNRLDVLLNFERSLFTIQSLSSVLSDVHNNYHLNPFINVDPLPEIIKFRNEITIADGNDLYNLYGRLIDKLAVFFRERCRSVLVDKGLEIKKLKSLILALEQEFQIGIVNLNYDNALLSACNNLRTGFDPVTGHFDKSIAFQDSWDFLYHLHGSVHFDMKGEKHDMHQIKWNPDLSSVFSQNSSGRNSDTSTEGFSHRHSTIITGLDKANQLLKEPFLTYYSQLVRLAYEADAILFLGYGFGDKHLNRCFSFNRFDGKKRKIVIVDWANMDEDGLQFRHDHWTYGLFNAVPYNSHEMLVGTSSLPYPAHYFKAHNLFERSSNPELPMSVWYNGLLNACDNKQLIVRELMDS